MDFKVTHTKITELIVELRSWEEDTPVTERPTMNELGKKFGLPVETVRKIAEAEGVDIRWVDPNASTIDLDPEEIDRALGVPESNPNYEDRDTGVWKQDHGTGKWERIGPGHTKDESED